MENGSTEPVEVAAEVGVRVKARRLACGLTLDELAARSSVSRRTIVNIEQGSVSAGLGVLVKLSTALGVSLATLVDDAPRDAAKPAPIELWRGESGGLGQLVASTAAPDVVELWQWQMHPGERHASDAHSSGTQELLYVHTGILRVVVGQVEHHVGPSHALSFSGDIDHAYETYGSDSVTFTMTVFQPGVHL